MLHHCCWWLQTLRALWIHDCRGLYYIAMWYEILYPPCQPPSQSGLYYVTICNILSSLIDGMVIILWTGPTRNPLHQKWNGMTSVPIFKICRTSSWNWYRLNNGKKTMFLAKTYVVKASLRKRVPESLFLVGRTMLYPNQLWCHTIFCPIIYILYVYIYM